MRLPRSIIKECGFGDQIEMRVERGSVVLAPIREIRDGWDAAFQRMAANQDDTLLVADNLEHKWDAEEWEW